MTNYYSKSLHSNRLKKCYDVAPERVKQFLEAEIDFVLDKTMVDAIVLDLGCGYGRVTTRLAAKANAVVGIDISGENLRLAGKMAGNSRESPILKGNQQETMFLLTQHLFGRRKAHHLLRR